MKKTLLALSLFALSFSAQPASAQSDEAIEAMEEYLMFANYEAGIILPAQIDEAIFNDVLFIDTRDAEQFEAETIPGAINIEWREVLMERESLPSDQKIVLFCNTGSLSSQALFSLRVAGFENAVVMQTGFNGWKETAAFKPE